LVLAGAGVILGTLIALVALTTGGGEAPAVVASTPSPSATVSPPATPPPSSPTPSPTATVAQPGTPTPTPTPEATQEPGAPSVKSVKELVDRYGEPPDSTFGRMRIPPVGVDTGVGQRFVGTNGVMPLPSGPSDAVWYDMTPWPGMGGRPGEGGNAIFSGHVDYAAYVPYADVDYRGRGVFFLLGLLSPGDVIEVDYNGEALRYAVSWRRQISAADGDWAAIWSDDVPKDSITLVTCAGQFDSQTRKYLDRVVIRAERI
jgi:hypothetical protein